MSKIRKSPQKQTAIRAKEAFTESLRLPRDVMLGASILTLIGDTELLVENYRGILEYTQECILLQGKHSRIRIEGCFRRRCRGIGEAFRFHHQQGRRHGDGCAAADGAGREEGI